MAAMNRVGLALTLFTVDGFGSLGPMTRTLLFGDAVLDPPPHCKMFLPEAQAAYNKTVSPMAPSGILPAADAAWREDPMMPDFFGRMHHSTTPSDWAMQVLGFNITAVLVGQVQRGISGTDAVMAAGVARRYMPGKDLWGGRFARRGANTETAATHATLTLVEEAATAAEAMAVVVDSSDRAEGTNPVAPTTTTMLTHQGGPEWSPAGDPTFGLSTDPSASPDHHTV